VRMDRNSSSMSNRMRELISSEALLSARLPMNNLLSLPAEFRASPGV
jgi:hypothetical protein